MKKTIRYPLTVFAVLLSTLLYSQKKNPDAVYVQTIDKIYDLTKAGKPAEAADAFLELEKSYKIWGTDMVTFLQVSVEGKNAPAFDAAMKWMAENSFDDLETMLQFVENGAEKVHADKALSGIYEKHRKLPRTLNPSLDLRAISMLQEIMAGDRSVRMTMPELPPSKAEKYLTHSDSVRFEEFYTYCEKNGFPKWTEMGLYAGGMQTFLSHLAFFGMRGKETDKSPTFLKWLTVAGWIHTRVKEGEFPARFFRKNLLGNIKYILEKHNRAKDFEHFRPFLNGN